MSKAVRALLGCLIACGLPAGCVPITLASSDFRAWERAQPHRQELPEAERRALAHCRDLQLGDGRRVALKPWDGQDEPVQLLVTSSAGRETLTPLRPARAGWRGVATALEVIDGGRVVGWYWQARFWGEPGVRRFVICGIKDGSCHEVEIDGEESVLAVAGRPLRYWMKSQRKKLATLVRLDLAGARIQSLLTIPADDVWADAESGMAYVLVEERRVVEEWSPDGEKTRSWPWPTSGNYHRLSAGLGKDRLMLHPYSGTSWPYGQTLTYGLDVETGEWRVLEARIEILSLAPWILAG